MFQQECHYIIVSALDNQWEDQVPIGEVELFVQPYSQLERAHCLPYAKSVHHVCQAVKALAFNGQ